MTRQLYPLIFDNFNNNKQIILIILMGEKCVFLHRDYMKKITFYSFSMFIMLAKLRLKHRELIKTQMLFSHYNLLSTKSSIVLFLWQLSFIT